MKNMLILPLLVLIACNMNRPDLDETSKNSPVSQNDTIHVDSMEYVQQYGGNFPSFEKINNLDLHDGYKEFRKDEAKLRAFFTSEQVPHTGVIMANSGVIYSNNIFSKDELHAIFLYRFDIDSVKVELYAHQGKAWKMIQKTGSLLSTYGASLRFDDFNGDKVDDVLIFAMVMARGSNYKENLLLLDPERNRFIHVPEFSELTRVSYDSTDNTLLSVGKHATWFASIFVWEEYDLKEIERQICWWEEDTLFRSMHTVDSNKDIPIRVDKISRIESKTDDYTIGPEPWDKRFGKSSE